MDYTLVTEGRSDKALLRPLDWLLNIYCLEPFSGKWANPGAMDDVSRNLTTRMTQVQQYFPADLYFVHRDTDTSAVECRKVEIVDALARAGCLSPVVCVVPTRMTEAWFLFDEGAIRRAADRARGTTALSLPDSAKAQRVADPKVLLEDALTLASELSGRKLAHFRAELGRRKALVAANIEDFSPLRHHASFRSLEHDVAEVMAKNGWARGKF